MELFGWLKKKNIYEPDDAPASLNQISDDYTDGAIKLNNAINNFILNFDWIANNQSDLIEKYREIATYAEVDFAIQDIINEMVSFSDDEDPVKIDLEKVELSDGIKKRIIDAWEHIFNILNLKDTIYQRAYNFYVDGRLGYQKVVDEKRLKQGLQNVIELDVRYLTKYRNIIYDEQKKTIKDVKEFFIYNENERSKGDQTSTVNNVFLNNQQFKEALQLSKESITYVTSGLTDPKSGYAISWLHKAIKPANQLQMMENALVIYRIVRAPERRVFYVDVGNLPKSKAEQYLNGLKDSYRNRMSYDPDKGTFKDDKHLMTMQEDFWLPRTSTGNSTQIDTLSGAANLGDIEDVMYFLKRLYKALNTPVSRLEQDSLINFGSSNTEINRDELKFSKFISKIRKRFNIMFKDLLRTHLILTNVMTEQEWSEIENYINFVYTQDLYIEERKYFEMMRDRIELANELQPFVGKYYAHDFIRTKILNQTDEEKDDMDKKIKEEKTNPQFQEPIDDEGNPIPSQSYEQEDTTVEEPPADNQDNETDQEQ